MYGFWMIPLAIVITATIIIPAIQKKRKKESQPSLLVTFIISAVSIIVIFLWGVFFELELEYVKVEEKEIYPFNGNSGISGESYLSIGMSDGEMYYIYMDKNEKSGLKANNVMTSRSYVNEINSGEKATLDINDTKLKSKFARWMYGGFYSGVTDKSKTITGKQYVFNIPKGTLGTMNTDLNK